jgi:predicted phosphodiesterase
MKVAVLADVHGNLPALEAVLRDVEGVGVDAVVLNGDVAAGPLPGPTLDRLLALGERAVWVRGNADRELVEAHDGTYEATGHAADGLTRWAGRSLSPAHRDLLAALPLSVALDVDGLGATRFCHATARSDAEIVLVDSPVARFEDCFAGVAEATVVLGHTHMPFARLARRRYVNPGSVGMPYGHDGAAWALLGPGVELRRTPYDAAAAAAAIRASACPGGARWAEDYVLHQASDVEALAVFSAQAGQH